MLIFDKARRIQMLKERHPDADMSEIIEMEAEFYKNAMLKTLPYALMVASPLLGTWLALVVSLILWSFGW